MRYLKILTASIFALICLILIVLHIGTAMMSYSDDELVQEIPYAAISMIGNDKCNFRLLNVDNVEKNTAIIFVHGAPGSLDAFKYYLNDSLLQSRATLIAYDRPGYSLTCLSPMTSIIEQSKILLNIINSRSEKNIILVGHSYGTPIAAYTSALAPNRVKHCIMIAPLINPDAEPIFWYSYLAHWPITKWMLPKGFQIAGDEKFAHAAALREIENSWRELQVPVTHIHGTKDNLAPQLPNTTFSKEHIPSQLLDLQIYPNEGHLILWQNYALIRDEILKVVTN